MVEDVVIKKEVEKEEHEYIQKDIKEEKSDDSENFVSNVPEINYEKLALLINFCKQDEIIVNIYEEHNYFESPQANDEIEEEEEVDVGTEDCLSVPELQLPTVVEEKETQLYAQKRKKRSKANRKTGFNKASDTSKCVLERMRRKEIRNSFTKLCLMVGLQEGTSKLYILNEAVKLCRSLRLTQYRLISLKQQEKRLNIHLKRKLTRLLNPIP